MKRRGMADCLSASCLLLLFSSFRYFITTEAVIFDHVHDIAAGKPAHQSSVLGLRTANLAVDQDPQTCARTLKEKHSNWTIDLLDQHTIAGLQVDTGNATIGYVEVFVTHSKGSGASPCRFYSFQKVDKGYIQCSNPTQGRYVLITTPYAKRLTLCTVKIIECDDGYFGLKCNKECHCLGNTVCRKKDGHCSTGCGVGWKGVGCQFPCDGNKFGLGCSKECHCKGGAPCDRVTGRCHKCDPNYFGNDCQTALPEVKDAPEVTSSTPTSMVLRWRPWEGYVAPALQVIYRIQYSRHRHYGNGTQWNSGQDSINPKLVEGYAEATLKGLQHNTFYIVRVLPLLWHQAKLIRGGRSPTAGPFRTKCAKPAAPYISKIVTGLDESEAPTTAMLSVKWEGPDEGQVNCDNILYYKLLYQRQGSGGWQKVMVGSNQVMHNISGLNFSTGYNIKVEVINNQNLVAQSAMLNVVTPAREVGPLERSDSTIMVVCIIIAFIIILGAIIAMLLYRKRRAKYDPVPPKESASPQDGAPVQLNSFVKVESKEGTPTGDSGVGVGGSSDISPSSAANSINDAVPSQLSEPEVDTIAVPSKPPRNIPPIQVDELEEYIMTRRANDSEELRSEYKDIPEGFTATYAYGKKTENKHKNRFVNIIAYDHSRVILDKEAGDEDSDYINASYIDGYKEPQQYIAAQGCTKWTIQDMWRMLWQVDSHRIIMATNLVENGKRKCEKYWPDKLDEGKMYGNIQVKLVEVEETSDFIIRTFDITKNGETRNIKQFHFTSWPDHGVPTRAAPLIALRKKVRSFDNTHPGCIIVHCSAGVGRTGTFIALDYLLSQAAAEGQVDIYGLTRSMRKDRVNMIQTVEQYLFVYDALLEALFSAHTTIPCSEFASRFEELCKVDPESDTGKTALQLQFEKLESMSPEKKACDYQSGILKENTQKNRCADILPADRHRPYLMTRVQGTNDYINAVFLDGHRSRNAYIITQMPMPHTVIDFWRMVYEHRCGSIVMLNAWNGDVKEGYGQYWPEDETCECGPFVIDPVSVDTTNKDITVRELKLTYQPESTNFAPAKDKVQANGQVAAPSGGKVMTVNQFQLNCWPLDTATPASKNILVALTELVEKSQLKTGNGPIVIHCHDGLRQSGLYATISCMWEKMKVEQEVDIFHTVKHLRYYRANIIQDLEQYKFCYEMVLAYLAEFDTYSNFR